MDEAVRARTVTREAVEDIAPAPLRELIDDRLAAATVTPGVLVRLAAGAAGYEVDPVELDRRCAGVQLIYDGLALTRHLARHDAWETESAQTSDLEVLAADVLVARGFYLLARTEAAPNAVETVRTFGRAETDREADGAYPAERSLEADVFELAVLAGATAASGEPPEGVRSFAVRLARSADGEVPPPEALLEGSRHATLRSIVTGQELSTARPERPVTETGSTVGDP